MRFSIFALQVVTEPSFYNGYLSLSNEVQPTHEYPSWRISLNRTYEEIQKLNQPNVHMYIWFTNFPRIDDPKEANLTSVEKAPGGVTRRSKLCTKYRSAIIRGPDRNDLHTAGVFYYHQFLFHGLENKI